MRLNLPNVHCREFSVESNFVVPKSTYEAIGQLMEGTLVHSHGPDDDYPEATVVAVFGSTFTVDGMLYRARANLSSSDRQDDVSVGLRIVHDKAPTGFARFQRGVKPVSMLVDAAAKLFGSIEFTCDALFDYDESSEYRSSLPLPIPLLAPEAPGGVTHIENAEFSRRDDTGIDYRILVLNSSDSSSVVHAVHFESVNEVTRRTIRQSLNRAHSISSRLLILTGEQ